MARRPLEGKQILSFVFFGEFFTTIKPTKFNRSPNYMPSITVAIPSILIIGVSSSPV